MHPVASRVIDRADGAMIPNARRRATATLPHEPGAMLPTNAVEIAGLSKTYAKQGKASAKRALDAVSLTIRRGELFGLLGPNGAGKSTLINIMAGLVLKSAGSVKVWDIDLDEDPRGLRAAIGVVPQELNVDPFFTPAELLDLQAGLYGVPKAERRTRDILAALGLADRADSYSRTLSGGMRRRLLVAKAMVHAPPVLVLDEPTAGVDVELRHQLWGHVRELNRAGTTVLLTTHYLPEAEQLCDRIAIINHGALIACDSTAALVGRLDQKVLRLTLDADLASLPDSLRRFEATLEAPRRIAIRYRPSTTRVGELLAAAAGHGLVIADLSTEEGDLEDIFLALTRASGAPTGQTAA
jgi:ABC-2 type transport system ATP-binding protein